MNRSCVQQDPPFWIKPFMALGLWDCNPRHKGFPSHCSILAAAHKHRTAWKEELAKSLLFHNQSWDSRNCGCWKAGRCVRAIQCLLRFSWLKNKVQIEGQSSRWGFFEALFKNILGNLCSLQQTNLSSIYFNCRNKACHKKILLMCSPWIFLPVSFLPGGQS